MNYMSENGKIDWIELASLNEEEIEKKARELLNLMSIEEKVKQMSGDGTLIIDGPKMLKKYNAKPIPAGRNKRLGIPGVLFSDGPRGVVMGNSTCFPVSMARGASWDIDLEERIGDVIGVEAKAQGANFFGGVCINLLRHPAWGRAQETYGEDTHLLGEMGAALVRGTQKHVMACAKHYACNSIENARFKVNVKVDERTLREVYLAHFKRCVDEGVASIMSAYNKVNGYYCGHNKHLLTDILKNDWGFKGFVVSDFIWGVRDGKAAINAGLDIEMPFKMKMKPKKVLALLNSGEIKEEQINDSVLRVLKQLIRFARKPDPILYSKYKVVCKEHTQLALEAARKSIVLLKNKNNVLPIQKETVKKIAVIGELALKPNLGDYGSSRVRSPYFIAPLEGIKNIAGAEFEVNYEDGKDIEKAKILAQASDIVIIVAGLTYKDEGEWVKPRGGDRDSLRLHLSDEELIKSVAAVNQKCIVIMEGGSAIITEEWKDKVLAILMAWYPGLEGGTAIAEILFGLVIPCAKLPVVFPKFEKDLPFFDKYAKEIEYGYYHGYKLMEKKGTEPAFPFGFGLSYNKYSYKSLVIDKQTVKINDKIEIGVHVMNTGSVVGEEIVQMYVGYKGSCVDRPVKELKGFGKILMNPGEIKELKMTLKPSDLAYYDPEKKCWEIEPIEYELFVGPSSRTEDLLTRTFRVIK